MKQCLLTLLFGLMTITGLAQSTGEIMYVYRNDGELNTFLRSEVQEFSFSRLDAEGKEYEDIVSQLIVTPDSTYLIPLAAIDSIGFVTPATVYQPGVTEITGDLLSYVERSDSLTIFLKSETPQSVLPKVGDKLVFTEMTDKFPAGFAGQVKTVNGTIVECETLKLEEVFETYYNTVVSEGYQESQARHRASGDECTFNLPTWSMDFGTELSIKSWFDDKIAVKFATKFEVAITPVLKVKTSYIINPQQGTNISVNIKGDYDVQETVGLSAGLEYSGDFFDKERFKQAVAPFTYFYIKPGGFYRGSIIGSLSGIWSQHFVSNTTMNFCSKQIDKLPMTNHVTITSSDYDFEASIDGSIAAGAFVELGLTFLNSEIDKVCLRGELGTELVGHFVLLNSDVEKASKSTKIYEALKSSDISWNGFISTTVQAELGAFSLSRNLPFNLKKNFAKWDLVPTFESLSFEQSYSPRTSAYAGMNVKGNCFGPRKVGFKVFTEEEAKEVGSWMSDDNYTKGGKSYTHQFDGLEDDGDYVLQPVVNFLGFDLLANPTVGIEKNEFPVRIVSFEQTGSHYSKQQGYEYDGKNYFYKFNATTTVELSDKAENVKDWGYIYHDFYGVDKKISCANLGSRTYADERYAYYYNDTQRTVELSPYVQFNDGSEIQVGKKKVYYVEYVYSGHTCPDENHPHAIDLGLPSGTLWSCCNVGASKPEDSGGYYRWGEIKEISGDESTYEFLDFENLTFQDIGADIAGTQYDVAHVEWGKGWKMPTDAQLTELKECCGFEFEYQEDLSSPGYLRLTGPSGNSILIPAAGAKIDASSYDDDHSPVNYTKTESSERYEYFGQLYSSTRSNVLGSAVYMAFRPRYYIWYYPDGKTEITKDFNYYSVFKDLNWTTVLHGCSIRPIMENK